LIDFKMSDMLHDPAKTCKHSSFLGSSPAGPNTRPRPLKRLDWHLCMPPVGWLHRTPPGVHRHPLTRPSPPGLAALLTVHGELRFSRAVKEPATEHLRMFTRASSDAHPNVFGHSPEPPGSTERLRAFNRAPSDAHLGTFGRPTGGPLPSRTSLSRLTRTTCGS